MREIVIDTETTRLDSLDGHRIIEIGEVELINRSPTGQTFRCYLCPERSMPADALAVHGLTAAFLADKPLFGAVADEFLSFVGNAPLVAHNAGLDTAFLNAELKRAAQPADRDRASDRHAGAARRKHAGGLSLDDLCPRYAINSLTRQAALQLEPITSGSSNIGAIVSGRPRPLPPCA